MASLRSSRESSEFNGRLISNPPKSRFVQSGSDRWRSVTNHPQLLRALTRTATKMRPIVVCGLGSPGAQMRRDGQSAKMFSLRCSFLSSPRSPDTTVTSQAAGSPRFNGKTQEALPARGPNVSSTLAAHAVRRKNRGHDPTIDAWFRLFYADAPRGTAGLDVLTFAQHGLATARSRKIVLKEFENVP
jgi:hypothetical protein